MPMRLQVKLLRVLQENVIRPVGSTDAIPVNVRVISATHRDLQQLMAAGQFREDLYYRLNVVHIEMPPLNRRREDIPLLVAHFLAQIAKEIGRAQDLRARGGRAARHGRLARQHPPAAERRAPERGAVTDSRSSRWSWCSSHSAAPQARLPSFDEARDEFTRSYLSQILQITRRQRQSGGTAGETQPHGLLQAAGAAPAHAGRIQAALAAAAAGPRRRPHHAGGSIRATGILRFSCVVRRLRRRTSKWRYRYNPRRAPRRSRRSAQSGNALPP